jgi:hypothetical protein
MVEKILIAVGPVMSRFNLEDRAGTKKSLTRLLVLLGVFDGPR